MSEGHVHAGIAATSGVTFTLEYQGKEYELTEKRSPNNTDESAYEVDTETPLPKSPVTLRYTFNNTSDSLTFSQHIQLQEALARTPIPRIKKEKGSKLTEEEKLAIEGNIQTWYENAGYPTSIHFNIAKVVDENDIPQTKDENNAGPEFKPRPGKAFVSTTFPWKNPFPAKGDWRETTTVILEHDVEDFIERVEPNTSTPVDTPSSAPQNQDTPVSTDKQADPTPTTPAASTSAQTKKALAFTGAHTTPLLALAAILGTTGLIMLRKRNTANR